MSRTSKTLLRLGVPTLAAATMLGGVPAFLGTANAAHIQGLTLTPANPSTAADAAAGTCVPFTATLTFNAGQAPRAEDIDVIISEAGTANASQDVDFCTAPTGDTQPATADAGSVSDTGAAGSTDQAEFTTTSTTPAVSGGANGTASVTFGVVASAAGTVNIRAFYEVDGATTDNNQFDAGEFTAQSSVDFAEGGVDETESVEVVSTTETLGVDTDQAVEGETRTYRVRVTNTANNTGLPLAGIPVSFVVDSNDNTADRAVALFGTTNNEGIATGTITFPVRANATSADAVTFFVNESTGSTPGFNSAQGENADTLNVTVLDNAAQQNRTVTVQCITGEVSGDSDNDTDATAAGTVGTSINTEDPCVNGARDRDRQFRALVNADDTTGPASTEGTLLSFAVSGGSGDEVVTPTEASTTAAAAGTTGDTNDSAVTFELFDPTPVVGQTLTVTATVRGTTTSDTETLTFRNEVRDARNIAVTPDSGETLSGGVRTFTARVTDVNGAPVRGVIVDFTENGAGFIRGSETDTTDANGNATVELTSAVNETGAAEVTGTVRAGQGTQTGATAGTGTAPGTTPQGGTAPASATAGNASDTGRTTFVTTLTSPSPSVSPSATATVSPSPSATPTSPAPSPSAVSPSPSGTVSPPPAVACATPLSITTNREFIIPGIPVTVTVSGFPSGADVQLQAYSRPNDQFAEVRRVREAAGNSISFDVTPGTNTRLFATCAGQQNSASNQRVINVRTALSLSVVRNGTRNYTFQGRILPRRAGQLITLYRVNSNGSRVLTSQIRTDDSGTYRINRRFTGSGTFGFLTRTGQTLTNVSGESTSAERQRSAEYLQTGRGTARPTAIF